ncbi:purine-cytosine permease FCY2 [Myxozyma melibiosi]|uniref:Purine-cytosine permease FCY2 n=1 Tax=Myxozyma melibiosi TaxID=54550 RepID=A0ABR1F2H4_9ASCO
MQEEMYYEKTNTDSLGSLEKGVDVDTIKYDESTSGSIDTPSFLQRFAERFNMETRGIEIVPESEKVESSLWNAASMWFAANMVVSTFAMGLLGISIFGMTFWDSVLTIIFFNFIGMLPVAFFSTFGPEFGLRQMILSRYWFGYHIVKIFAALNCIACVGWAAVNTVVAAQLLHSVNDGGLPAWGGVIVISAGGLFITIFGYKIVHFYERWAWIPTAIIFLIVIARLKISGAFTAGTMGTGRAEAGAVLSFGASLYGFATGWATFACDFVVYQRKDTSKTKIFFSIICGLGFPLCFCEILGAACMSGTLSNADFLAQYNNNGTGGLLFAILVDDSLHGFGQFCVVVLALSTIANNCPNLYSVSLSVMTVSDYACKVPRFVWSAIATGVVIAIAIPAYYHFTSFMDNFMNIIGYWLAIYEAIALSEHFIFKRGFSGYDVSIYQNPSKLPIGLAAFGAFCCGVMGAVMGMSQEWFTGPIAKLIPGDVGFLLGFGFALVAYVTLRPLELKYFGR